MSTIISKIVEARASQGISETQLASKVGLTQKTLNNLLSGRTKRLDMDVVNKLNTVLGLVSEPLTGYEAATIHRALTPDQEQILQVLEGKPIAQQFIMDMMQLDEPDMLNAYSDFVRNWKGKN